MKTAIAISPMMTNILSVAKIPPATVTTSQMARIAPRIVPMTRPMSPVCARRSWQPAAVPARGAAGRLACVAGRRPVTGGHSLADAGHVVTAGLPGPARTSGPTRWLHGGTSPRRGTGDWLTKVGPTLSRYVISPRPEKRAHCRRRSVRIGDRWLLFPPLDRMFVMWHDGCSAAEDLLIWKKGAVVATHLVILSAR